MKHISSGSRYSEVSIVCLLDFARGISRAGVLEEVPFYSADIAHELKVRDVLLFGTFSEQSLEVSSAIQEQKAILGGRRNRRGCYFCCPCHDIPGSARGGSPDHVRNVCCT